MTREMRIALCQMQVGSCKEENIENARKLLFKAVEGKAKVAVLPEIWNSPYSTSSFGVYAEHIPSVGESIINELTSPSTRMLCEQAKTDNIWIIGGSIPEKEIDQFETCRLYNTCVIVNPLGQIVGKHRKIHLFDIDVPGKIKFKESDSLTPGNCVTTFDTEWGKLGVGICYDIRFPELAMLMRQRGCVMMIYPGAFNMITGPAHWELLQRARAVDNQVYVATCSPARNELSDGYIAWGHSSIVSPWGEVISNAGPGENVVFADIDFENVHSMRQNIPCWHQKRTDLYELLDKSS